jgi:hypothetical protein
MRKLLFLAAAILAPMLVSAQIGVGASLGLSIPMGDVASSVAMDEYIQRAIPLEVSLRAALAPQLTGGAYLNYAPGTLNDDLDSSCPAGETCSIYTWGFGVMGEYALGAPAEGGGGFIPFIGARAGLSWMTLKEELDGDWAKAGFKGWEFGVQGGIDTPISETATIGGFVGLTVGQYNTVFVAFSDSSIGDDSMDITDTAMHQWLTIGVRGKFGP